VTIAELSAARARFNQASECHVRVTKPSAIETGANKIGHPASSQTVNIGMHQYSFRGRGSEIGEINVSKSSRERGNRTISRIAHSEGSQSVWRRREE